MCSFLRSICLAFSKLICRSGKSAGLAAEGSMHGDAGSFFQGVFATVLATPCTAPFLGTALGFAFTQSATVILLMFGAIAPGMSAPYFLLSAQPAWLRFLPKPGPWMERVKQLMGFLLFATLLFLLSVLGAQRGVEALIWTCAVSSRPERRLLDERRLSLRLPLPQSPRSRARAHARARNRQRIYFIGDKFQSAAAVANPTASGTAGKNLHPNVSPRNFTGSFRLHRFHRRMVHHLQIQRINRARNRSGASRIFGAANC